MIRVKKGLNIPIAGEPEQSVSVGAQPHAVALVGDDYVGIKPAFAVTHGESVKLGQVLFTDRRCPEIRFTSPGTGTVEAIHRGKKRRFLSIAIRLEGDEEERFPTCDGEDLTADIVRQNLVSSGLWTALRTRPYNKIPAPDSSPHSIFVTAIDTSPLAADPSVPSPRAGMTSFSASKC